MEKLGLNVGYILVQIIAFLLLVVVLNAWVYKPLMTLLQKRREKIAASLEDARVANEARASAERDAEQIIAEAQTKAAQIVSQATERADSAMSEAKAQAEKDIEREREATLQEVSEERNRMLGDLRGQVAALAIAASHKLIGEALDERRQHALLQEFFSGVRSGHIVGLDDGITCDEAEVVSALPLTAEEQKTIHDDLLAKAGPQVKVEYKVDPSILGGLVVKVGDKVIDGSVAGQLDGLRASMR